MIIDVEKLIGIRDAAAILGLTPQRVSQLIKDGELKPMKVDNKFFFNRDEIEEYAEQRKVKE